MRAFAAWILPAAAAYTAWWALLGRDADDQYTVPQAGALVVLLIVIAVASGWLARRSDLLPVTVSAVMGVAVACWTSWSDDGSGLFVVGWLMVVVGSAMFGTLLVLIGYWLRQRSRAA